MKHRLTERDIDSLRYQGKMSFIISGMFFTIATAISIMIYKFEFSSATNGFSIQIALLIASVFLLLSFLLSQAMNRKYYADIRNNQKIAHTKILQRKNSTNDYENRDTARKMGAADRMRDYVRYELIVDNVKYNVEKDLFDQCSEGDELVFYIAPVSKHLLSIEKK